ncbi:hypothetical protein EZI45_19130 [Delftia tsuruhatensis]|jgi:hypothetical protein|uniref:hypothetical protein n=1 Tax=Delftia TaxID=80865 RepID=UPI00034E8E0C|nr:MULTISPECIES: hypothetical protein [Delftia]EPD35472.1 hypothetical protein HMPREF9702_05961 [Delftia acidovorans CCUG 15835]EPD39158.1 hypothetical protein HMPREF9701_03123 [Delftia acidovorans CCUG 274B]TDF26235.1 hypothetical protein EZI45_19130 [Delftia tsuruhatensis]
MRKVLSVGLLVLLVLGACIYMYGSYLVHQHRKPVLAELKDPDSAQFRNERLVRKAGFTLEGTILCGEVNAKNEMGGFAGYKPFASAANGRAEIGSDAVDRKFVELYCE